MQNYVTIQIQNHGKFWENDFKITANPRNWKEHSDIIAFFSRQKGCTQMENPFGYGSEAMQCIIWHVLNTQEQGTCVVMDLTLHHTVSSSVFCEQIQINCNGLIHA